MKIFLIFSTLLVSVLSLKAQSYLNVLEKTTVDSTQYIKSAVFGGGIIISGLGDLPGFGYELKGGIGFLIKDLQLCGCIELNNTSEEDIMLSGFRRRSTQIILSQLMIIPSGSSVHPFIAVGLGHGSFKVNWDNDIAKANKLAWSIGAGIKYKVFICSVRYMGPKVLLHLTKSGDILPMDSSFTMNNTYQITIGILFNSNI